MNRFSKRWLENQDQQIRMKLDLAIRLEEIGVTIIEPEKMELEHLRELHDKHFINVQKNRVKIGKYLNYREIAELAGVNYFTFLGRINRGYSLEKAILGKLENYLTYKEIAEQAGIPYQMLLKRMRQGYTLENVLANEVNSAGGRKEGKGDRRARRKAELARMIEQLNVGEEQAK